MTYTCKNGNARIEWPEKGVRSQRPRTLKFRLNFVRVLVRDLTFKSRVYGVIGVARENLLLTKSLLTLLGSKLNTHLSRGLLVLKKQKVVRFSRTRHTLDRSTLIRVFKFKMLSWMNEERALYATNQPESSCTQRLTYYYGTVRVCLPLSPFPPLSLRYYTPSCLTDSDTPRQIKTLDSRTKCCHLGPHSRFAKSNGRR